MRTIKHTEMIQPIREPIDAAIREQKSESLKHRDTCESALREAGVDEVLVAKKLKEQLEAMRPRWNPKKNAFQLFPDYRTRLAALAKIADILGGFSLENGESNITWIMDLPPKKPRPTAGDVGERSERSRPNRDKHNTVPNEPNPRR